MNKTFKRCLFVENVSKPAFSVVNPVGTLSVPLIGCRFLDNSSELFGGAIHTEGRLESATDSSTF